MGETDLEEAVRVLKRDTRHFAKRQLTWFRREEALWIQAEEGETPRELLGKIREGFGENTPCN